MVPMPTQGLGVNVPLLLYGEQPMGMVNVGITGQRKEFSLKKKERIKASDKYVLD